MKEKEIKFWAAAAANLAVIIYGIYLAFTARWYGIVLTFLGAIGLFFCVRVIQVMIVQRLFDRDVEDDQ